MLTTGQIINYLRVKICILSDKENYVHHYITLWFIKHFLSKQYAYLTLYMLFTYAAVCLLRQFEKVTCLRICLGI